uniref:TNFR-Cys domain-containing protein n=1 Tax=Branchiostoma floridae TaxID=7739 RepID=C3ZLL1_BRAFL|eukprot:XP_002590473.1 hypothetical protein BRAFLDRAFT_86310 [Branchiostoma floridae]
MAPVGFWDKGNPLILLHLRQKDEGYYKVKDCTRNHQTECASCADGYYLEHPNFDSRCRRCTRCSPRVRMEEKMPCLKDQNRVCQCMKGYYIPPGQVMEVCIKHMKCPPGEGVSRRGSTTTPANIAPAQGNMDTDQKPMTLQSPTVTIMQPKTKYFMESIVKAIPATTPATYVRTGTEHKEATTLDNQTGVRHNKEHGSALHVHVPLSVQIVMIVVTVILSCLLVVIVILAANFCRKNNKNTTFTIRTDLPTVYYNKRSQDVTIGAPSQNSEKLAGEDEQAEAPNKTCNEIIEYSHAGFCCKKCPAGAYLKHDCLQDHGAPTCTVCPPGTYTQHDNHLRGCLRCHIPCNPLFGFIETKTCQPHHNRQCRCEEGMRRVHEVCVLIHQKPCPPGQGVVQKAKKDDTNMGQVPKDLDNSNKNTNHHSQSAQLLALIFIGVAILLIIIITLVWKKVKKQRGKQNDATPNRGHDGPAQEQLLDQQDAQDGEGAGVGDQAPANGQGQLDVAQGAGDVHEGAVQPHAGRPVANQPLQLVDATMIQMQQQTALVDARRQLVIYSQSTTIHQQNDFGSPNNVQVGQGNHINVGIENGAAQSEEFDEE